MGEGADSTGSQCRKAFGRLMKMEKSGGEPDVVGYDKKQANTSFLMFAPKSWRSRKSLL